ncbi:homoserine kinase [Agrilactobacillus yilanensis]|uniref:Homoserine kinase n=1 Tax=Agrilactobacillus yilanensis TaxID=2485997 RepID=A0ABW4JBW2_9LACO|nr:homoserine kinase [Agrilactobacillus yilanensis]
MKIIAPATSANLGPGFDSLGIALNSYLVVEVLEPLENWLVDHEFGSNVANDRNNLVVRTALSINPELSPRHLKVTSTIPLARGLGSSSSAIVAGLLLANELGQMNLDQTMLLQLATRLEGHPDNVAPAVLGDFVAATYDEDWCDALQLPYPKLSFIAYIPNVELRTKESREALPEKFAYRKAVHGASVGNVYVAAVAKQDIDVIGRMMVKDEFHEGYRRKLVPDLDRIRTVLQHTAHVGTYLSGAGPTVMTVATQAQTAAVVAALKAEPQLDGEVRVMSIDRLGGRVIN